MSKIGKKPINIPEEVKVTLDEDSMKVSANGKEISIDVLSGLKINIKGDEITFELVANNKQSRSNWGTMRSLVANAVEGLTKGFSKTLILEGVGYRMKKEGKKVVFSLGYSHTIEMEEEDGIELELDEKANKITIKGHDKAQVGQIAAEIRSFRKVEPYKGKGFRYEGEVVRRKAGKKAVTSA
ncbi:MAG: 50S ribosomal protein L6 [Candidatus Paceibacterota bacterium]